MYDAAYPPWLAGVMSGVGKQGNGLSEFKFTTEEDF